MNYTGRKWETHDIAIASALTCLDFPIISLNKSNPKRARFIFALSEGLTLSVEAFWAGNLRLDPQKYAFMLKTLKNRIYND
jgi:hypothetical protein